MFLIKRLNTKSTKEVNNLLNIYLSSKEEDRHSIFEKFSKNYIEDLEDLYDNMTTELLAYVLNLDVSIEEKKYILFNKKINKKVYSHSNVILSKNPKILNMRAKYGLKNTSETINHIILNSENGSSSGCGCTLCKLKHNYYTVDKRYRSIEDQLRIINQMESVLERSDKSQSTKMLNPFENELFQKNGLIFLKRPIEIKSKKKRVQPIRFTKKDKIKEAVHKYRSEAYANGNYKVGVLDPFFDISIVEERIGKVKNHLLNEIEKWGLERLRINDLLEKSYKLTLLP